MITGRENRCCIRDMRAARNCASCARWFIPIYLIMWGLPVPQPVFPASAHLPESTTHSLYPASKLQHLLRSHTGGFGFNPLTANCKWFLLTAFHSATHAFRLHFFLAGLQFPLIWVHQRENQLETCLRQLIHHTECFFTFIFWGRLCGNVLRRCLSTVDAETDKFTNLSFRRFLFTIFLTRGVMNGIITVGPDSNL